MRKIPDPSFPGDTGAPDAELTAALARFATEPERQYRPALAVLQKSRLLVPVVAVAREVEHDTQGLPREKTAEMATVLMRGRDGRLALLAFTSSAALATWDPEARPVAVPFRHAARAALGDQAAALVVDVAGPVLFVVEEADLRAAADGYRLVAVGGSFRWLKPSA